MKSVNSSLPVAALLPQPTLSSAPLSQVIREEQPGKLLLSLFSHTFSNCIFNAMRLSSTCSLAPLFATVVFSLPTSRNALQKRHVRVPAARYHAGPSFQARQYPDLDTGSETATFVGGGWLLSVSVGGQQMTLNMDTGSADL